MKYMTEYMNKHPLFSSIRFLNTKCPVGYNWKKCSSFDDSLECRPCWNYNPLRMLYEAVAHSAEIAIPIEVLLADCKMQLEKGEIYDKRT